MLQLLIMLLVAVVIGFAGHPLTKEYIPGGFAGSSIASLAGAWLGVLLLGSWGPSLLGVLLPPVIGAVGFMLLLGILSKMTKTTV
jgi:uncharacterized membrane protein YeaQ/YmgE (transglycosylase-associated protein family)